MEQNYVIFALCVHFLATQCRTDRDAVWLTDTSGPREPRISWGPVQIYPTGIAMRPFAK